jgi:hypothetical protein
LTITPATDAFANFTWVHTPDSGTLLTVSPFYHFIRGQYLGGPNDPLITRDGRSSHYVGGYSAQNPREIGVQARY